MKVCIIQPAYSVDFTAIDTYFEQELGFLAQCDDSMDLIVLPESCDIPCLASTQAEYEQAVTTYTGRILEAAAATAKRCHALLFVNATDVAAGWRNTTFAFDREGILRGKYDKQHLTPGEVDVRKRDSGYSYEFSAPTVLELEGLRFGFLTCYDFYFYEMFPNLARQELDFIIGCSHQRSDTHRALEMMTAFCAYNTNTYVVRASVSMGEDSPLGGCSCIAAPDGEILTSLKSRVGMATVELDPTKKYTKPAGFGNPPSPHWQYIEQGRRPWKYRPAGSAICLPDDRMPYPRVCAHRGFNTVAPENSMPAFGAAVASGAEEIEFDLWYTRDGEIVSIHDSKLERVSDGEGKVFEHTYAELQQYDFGVKFGPEYTGLRILKFEDILKKFACHTIMNIHVKNRSKEPYDPKNLQKIIDLIDKYDCRRYVYFMTGSDELLAMMRDMAPDITRCCGAGPNPELRWAIVDRAIRYGCKKVQLFEEYFNQDMIDKAHANGIRCNYFYADDPEQAKQMMAMGIDTLLTNDYQRISRAVGK